MMTALHTRALLSCLCGSERRQRRTGHSLPLLSCLPCRVVPIKHLAWFQSTRLHEARLALDALQDFFVGVSIHAPARGATPSRYSSFRVGTCFNPRACTRRDLPARLRRRTAGRFNPRACTRRDWGSSSSPRAARCFNPRACTRRDAIWQIRIIVELMFQSTRLHEARLVPNKTIGHKEQVSIHAPARGATSFI